MKIRGGREAGACTKFRLLMWKNFLQQWRHRGQTVVELLLPVLTMSLILILRSQIEPVTQDKHTFPSIRASTLTNSSLLILAGMNVSEISIAYSPRSEILDDILRSAITNLLIENADELLPLIIDNLEVNITIPPDINLEIFKDIIKTVIPLTAYNSSNDLRGVYAQEERTREVLVAVEFDDSLYDSSDISNNMTYALRFPEIPRLNSFFGLGGMSWRTDIVFPYFEVPGPRFPDSAEGGNDPGYVNEMFIALQQVISTELISRMTGGNSEVRNFEVHINRYPHPPFLEDLAISTLQILFPVFIMMSFGYTAVNMVRAITIEKEMELKEIMKIMGLPTWLHWTAWFCKQFIYLFIMTVLLVILLKVNWFSTEEGFSDYSVLTNTPWTIVFFFLMLYLTSTIFFCFMLSSCFSRGNTAAMFTGVIWFLTYIPALLLSAEVNMSTAVQIVTCLFINSAMGYGIQLLVIQETTGGMQWGEFMSSPSPDSPRFLFGHVVVMLLVDCVLYMLLALYLEQVFPGPYGTPKPWYFPFQLRFWCPKKNMYNKLDIAIADGDDENVTKENDPTNLTIGVKVSNLTKVYGTNVAVNNLSLNIYDDQITVLLGHNGAGKSTTISMLTGNLEVTRGSVTLAGYDITNQTVAARAHLGLCPQHNVLFNELTVREHLEFFAKLKGFSGKELDTEIEALIDKLELQEKRDQVSRGLSGGQKRRLCVGIALSGAARVVLLDEPTSGMDPASRRALWDLLQKEKEGRTVILTTHFMDEADILGDRVAIMARGRLQCVGSPYFLKQHYGVGYTLVVVKMEDFQTDACTKLINKYIPATTVKEDRGSEITYSLTNDHARVFEEMLTELENNVDTIKFKNYGLIATTLEDVFMSVGSDTKPDLNFDPIDDGATSTDASSDEVLKFDNVESLMEEVESATGFRLYALHVSALWLKLWLVWSRSWVLLLLQLLTPVLIMASTLGVLRYLLTLVPEVQPRLLTLEQGFTSTETLLNFNGTLLTSLGRLATVAYETVFNITNLETMGITVLDQPIEEYYLERGADLSEMSSMRHSVLIGATFGDTSATAWFSNFGYHDVAASLHAVHAALLRALRPGAELRVYNHPLETQYNDRSDTQLLLSMLTMQMSLGIGNSVGIVSGVYIMFYIKERVSRAKLLQKAAGVDPAVLWGSAATFDWFGFLIICVMVIVTCAAFNVQGLNTPAELGRIYLCLITYGAAMLPLHYLCSHLFKGPALGFVVMYFVNSLIGMMGAMIVEALSSPFLNTEYVAYVLDSVLQFFPLYSLVTSARELLKIDLTEFTCMQSCEQLLNVHPNITSCSMESMCGVLSMCCVRDFSHFEWEEPGVGRYLFCMMVSCAVFWLLLLLVEYRVFQQLMTRKRQPPPLDESQMDEDVVEEARHVQRAGPGARAQHCLVASGLSKYYGKHLAVDQISFTVSDSECFGLLGVNGAGKTSTFKMLMGDEAVSSGDAFVCGYSVKSNLAKVHENIGYCPQFDAVFGELTGRENLRVFAQLRGYPPAAAGARAALLAEQLGFGRHIDEKVSAYSGGTKRKLSTAIALVGGTRLVFVDEPTTGVDPAAKRQVWRALRAARRGGGAGGGRRGRGVVLTSHSMEECEALCTRLTIMVNGRFQCLGTPQHLKNKYSQGFTLIIKMKIEDDVPAGFTDSTMEAIKNYVNNNFTKPRLMEEYQGLLTYYLPERSVPWSKMFGIMERAKRERGVEDYSISQTTLEQIFLQFTKYQQ